MNTSKTKSKEEILCAIEKCKSISQLFELVRRESIVLRMQSLNSASSIEPKEPNIPTPNRTDTPLSRLKDAVRACVLSAE